MAQLAETQPRFTAREQELVYAVALRYMKDEERARDVAQEALLRAYRHRASFRGNARFSTWLYRVAATTSLMELRKERARRRRVDDDAPADEPTSDAPSPEETSAARDVLSDARRALAALGDGYAQVFLLRFLEGYSEDEVARRLRLSVPAVRSRAFRARRHLREQLAE